MFASIVLKEYMGLWAFIAFVTISHVQSESTQLPSVLCSSSQLLCGGSTCYDPITQYCTELGTIVQCIGACGNRCYNPSTQQCFNGTICTLNEQLCVVKYDSSWGHSYNPPLYQCYNPAYQACFNDSLCSHPYRSCNQQCLLYNQVCVNNVTVCNVTEGSYYYNYQSNQMQLCNGVCYDSATQQCINGVIQCINNCSGLCYNSSSQQCVNETICSLDQQLCVVKYESWWGSLYNPPLYQCYNPAYQACFNNSLCSHPYRSCNQQCLRYNEVCVNNVTVCNATNGYYSYQPDQIKICNGICYDSAIQQCINGIIQCINNCSGLCYNSSSQQCFNGTVCTLNEQLCVVKYDSSWRHSYNPPLYQCYNPVYQACFNDSLCSHPYRSCNQQCLLYNQVCVNNVTVCNVTEGSYYYNYQPNQMQLCNSVCYDSATQQCVGGHAVHCIRDPTTQECIDQSTYSQFPNTTSISTSIFSTITTTMSSVAPSCCPAKECTKDSDCCARNTECQCFRHNNEKYGSCLNPYIQPVCAEGCPVQERCRNDTDCCKCQCARVTVTNINGTSVTKTRCIPR